MRKNNRLTADGKPKPKKADMFKNNGEVDFERLRQKDSMKVPLRIDSRTTILVNPENCNEKYAQEFRDNVKASELFSN